MNRRVVSGIIFPLLLVGALSSIFNVQPTKASGTVYLRADGSIDPPTTPISSIDNVTYTFTDNIYDQIVVERDNIVVDGAGYTLQGTGSGTGIELLFRSNVTIRNTIITTFWYCIRLTHSSNNSIIGNHLTTNKYYGILLEGYSNYNSISGNHIANNNWGILLAGSSHNSISGNNITANNYVGILLYGSSTYGLYNISIYHNNFIDNAQQVDLDESFDNVWDDGYPSGGNYWSDYEDRYPDATEVDDSGIWDIPYEIDEDNQDNYPLVEPWSPLPRTIDELKTEIEELGSEGEIDNQGIVKSLIAKLNVAQKLADKGKMDEAITIFEAFIQQVQNLTAIHITPEAADLLIESAEYIISHL